MTGNEYQKLAGRTMNKELDFWETQDHAVLGINSEAGEIAGIYQKVYQGHDLELGHLMKEMGDLLWFVAELCTVHGVKMEDVMRMNIDKLKARFPEGFDAEHSLHRAKDDI